MTGKVGERKGYEMWVRCPFCGDSQSHADKAHMIVNTTSGLYHCYRCRIGGRLNANQLLGLWQVQGDLAFLEPVFETDPRVIPELIPGAGSSRPSALDRFHLPRRQGDGNWDAFEVRDPMTGEPIGVHLRFKKERLTLSEYRGVMWAGPGLPVSYPDRPLRVVEGPYDVVSQQDVAVLGTITAKAVKPLRGHFIILCPDGDIWTKPDLLDRFMNSCKALFTNGVYPYVMGIEIYPDELDPDEIPEEKRAEYLIDRRQAQELLKTYLAKNNKETFYNENLHEAHFRTVPDTSTHPRGSRRRR